MQKVLQPLQATSPSVWSPSWYSFSLLLVGIPHLPACLSVASLEMSGFVVRSGSSRASPETPPSLGWPDSALGLVHQVLQPLSPSRWPSAGLTLVWYWEAPNWTQSSRRGLTSAKERGRFTSLDLLAGCLPKQPRVQAATFFAAECPSCSAST